MLLAFLLSLLTLAQNYVERLHTVYSGVLHHEQVVDLHYDYFILNFGKEGAVQIIGDKDVPFIKWLVENSGNRLRIEALPKNGGLER